MRVKIYDGDGRDNDHHLCHTCRHSRIVRGRRIDEEIVFCDASHLRTAQITFEVTTCTDYCDKRLPTYVEMMEQAWILKPGTRRRAAGFVRASELEDEEGRQDAVRTLTDCGLRIED
jgi:hypothetical protein